jgi:peptide/nickel transport system permease protein
MTATTSDLSAPAERSRRSSDVVLRLRANKGALVGAVIVGTIVLMAIFAPLITPETPSKTAYLDRLQGRCCPGPSSEHWFGLDELGRDVFSRVVYGARVSLLVAVVSIAIGLAVGVALGAAAGYVGGAVESVIMRLIDIMLAFPSFLFAIGLVALLGPGMFQIMVAIGVSNVPIFARLLRGSMLGVRNSPYVASARVLGLPGRRVLLVHMLPNAISPVIVSATLAMATAIIETAGLGFLGLGNADPGQPEWGVMLANTTRYLQTAPHLAFFPGFAIVVTVLGFNLLGDGLREAIDPKLT